MLTKEYRICMPLSVEEVRKEGLFLTNLLKWSCGMDCSTTSGSST